VAGCSFFVEKIYIIEEGRGRWVAKLVARRLATAYLWVRIQTYLKKYKMDDISKGAASTL
jgi:hypothetical protein